MKKRVVCFSGPTEMDIGQKFDMGGDDYDMDGDTKEEEG